MTEIVACPACGMELPASDLLGQKEHLETNHPEVIEQRLRDAGFEKDEDGEWHDALLGEES